MTTEPLATFAADAPVVCALYAKENGLLNTKEWKRFKALAKREKKIFLCLWKTYIKISAYVLCIFTFYFLFFGWLEEVQVEPLCQSSTYVYTILV